MDVWSDKKHHLWWKLSFTKYRLTENKLYVSTGLFSTNYEEILLYRIVDCICKRSLLQKIFGTGSVILLSTDKSTPELVLKNIKKPLEVSEQISDLSLKARRENKLVEFA